MNHVWRRIGSLEVAFPFIFAFSYLCWIHSRLTNTTIHQFKRCFPFKRRIPILMERLILSASHFHTILLSLLLRLPFPLCFANVNGKQSIRWQRRICKHGAAGTDLLLRRECSGMGQFSVSYTLVSIALDVSGNLFYLSVVSQSVWLQI